jgi:hypothetical protein
MKNGIEYKLTGQADRGEVQNYHRKPDPLSLAKGAKNSDIAQLKPADKRQVLAVDGFDFKAKYTIGFEIEKNALSRNAVREYELFCGFERDASCGYEAVTHILPLLPASTWRNKVYDLFVKAEKIIDDRWSPSDKRCGGHITVAVDGMSGSELMPKLRKYSGIVYALFRGRLKNSYCSYNNRMRTHNDDDYQYGHHKYQTCLAKTFGCEFRLPSKVESVKQLMRRYELMYSVVNAAMTEQSYKSFYSEIKPLVLSMYDGDSAKADQILELAKSFQTYINTGDISDDIRTYLS